MSAIYNFSAGPAVLPQEVIHRAAEEMKDYKGCGMSVMEISHRSKIFEEIIGQAKEDLKELIGLPEEYEILFLQGGASLQFHMVPLNFLKDKEADYILSGYWAEKAYKEAQKIGKVNVAASSKGKGYRCIPKEEELIFSKDSGYVYLCENNTIYGTKFQKLPDTKGRTLIADVSSCFLSEPFDIKKYGMLFAGAQKNAGPAGVTIIVIKKDLLTDDKTLPSMLSYKVHADAGSLFHTPPVYGIYICGKVFRWIKEKGGLREIGKENRKKAKLFYEFLDQSRMFYGTADRIDRSIMNIPFMTGKKELDQLFLEEAKKSGLLNLKGHRLAGGMRASLYNAMPYEGVKALTEFMEKFERENLLHV